MIPPKRPGINAGQSGVSGDGSPLMGSRGTVPAGGMWDEVPQKLKLFAHLHC